MSALYVDEGGWKVEDEDGRLKQTRLEEAGDDAAGQAGIKLSARALSLSSGRKLI